MPTKDAKVSHDPGGSHLCPALGCFMIVPNDRAFCRQHWYAVPKPMRDAIWASYRAGNAGTVGHIELIQAAAKEIKPKDLFERDGWH